MSSRASLVEEFNIPVPKKRKHRDSTTPIAAVVGELHEDEGQPDLSHHEDRPLNLEHQYIPQPSGNSGVTPGESVFEKLVNVVSHPFFSGVVATLVLVKYFVLKVKT